MDDIGRRVLHSYVTYVVVGVVVGAAVAPVATNVAGEPEKTVVIIPIDGTIDGESAAQTTALLREARRDDSVAAVVLVVNSGGGTAAASEELYLQVKRTAREMPVVGAVDGVAASGAYYALLPSDRIYAKPASVVGSVGVLATTPSDLEPNDVVGATGPNKLSGYDHREFKYGLERLQEAFLGAVMANRGDALSLSRSEVAEARVWVGAEAASNGIVDAVGDRTAAVRDAADRAGLDDYRVRVLRAENGSAAFVSRAGYLASDAPDKRMVSPLHFVDDDGVPVYLMMPAAYFDGDAVEAGTVDGANTGSTGDAEQAAGNETAAENGTTARDDATVRSEVTPKNETAAGFGGAT